MADHAAPEFMAGLRLLGADAHSIPVLEEASERLQRLTGFEVIGVPGLIPEADFFAHNMTGHPSVANAVPESGLPPSSQDSSLSGATASSRSR